MKCSAVTAANHVIEEYKRFLHTSYHFLDPHLRVQFEEHLEQADVVVRGPFITLARDFLRTATLGELAREGVVTTELLKARWPFGEEALFAHQEKAVRAGCSHDSFIVTTGTGSGKTEAFLAPVLDHCLKAKGAGRKGVKAIFLYPMNALANDQLERIRRLLRGTGLEISYGLYTGDSDSIAEGLKEEPAEHERLKRADIRREPAPDIILTNFKQLEYMLVRQEDQGLFGPALKYLVLDELHYYKGALATEIACLIRRIKMHCGLKPGDLVGVGTSATVAEGEEGVKALAEFASTLFGETVAEEDIFTEEVAQIMEVDESGWTPHKPELTPEDVLGIDTEDEDAVVALAEKLLGRPVSIQETLPLTIFSALEGNAVVRTLEEILTKPKALDEVAAEVAARLPEREGLLPEELKTEIIAYLLVGSIGTEDDPPRLRPKLHTFFHGVYNVGICLNPDCRKLVPHGAPECPECGSAARPAAICRTCGQDFVKVRFSSEDDQKPQGDDNWFSDEHTAFLTRSLHSFADAEGEEEGPSASEDTPTGKLKPVFVCPSCGRVAVVDTCPSCNIKMQKYFMQRGRMSKCPACGSTYTRGDIVTPLSTGTASTVAVLSGRHLDYLEGGDRKMLVFSDSRQDAAHQAGYMNDRQRDFVLRHVIEREIRQAGPEGLSIEELPERILDGYVELGIAPRRLARHEKDKWLDVIEFEVASEFCRPTQLRISLENLGLAGVEYEFLDELGQDERFEVLVSDAGLDSDTAINLVRGMLDRMRRQRAVSYSFFQKFVDSSKRPWRELEAEPYKLRVPDNGRKPIVFALDRPDHIKKAQRAQGFFQENKKVGNLPALQRLAKRVIGDRDGAESFIRGLVPLLIEYEILEKADIKLPKRESTRGFMPLQVAKRVIRILSPDGGYRCRACRIWRAYDFPQCPTPGCENGVLENAAVDEDNYYVRLYTRSTPKKVIAAEHSGQIKGEDRAKLEEMFKEGKLEILVCTPTLELGVDIGDLLTILMRNAPPMPSNYIQRVGRSGRRMRTGFVSTFCGMSAHDRHAFEEPEWLVAGEFRPPRLRLDNPRIVLRHMRSYLLEAAENKLPRLMEAFVDNYGHPENRVAEPVELIYKEVELRASELEGLLSGLFEEDRAHGRVTRYGNEDAREIVGGFRDDLEKVLDKWWARVLQLDYEYNLFATIGSPRHDDQKAKARKRAYYEITRDADRAYCLGYLSEAGLLPAYQFPVDQFSLDSGVEDTPTLTRAAVTAIQEFAPGNLVYANGHKLKSIRALYASGSHGPATSPQPDLPSSGRVRDFYCCTNCDFATENVVNNCPRCERTMGSGEPVVFVEAFEAEEATRISADEEVRERRRFMVKYNLLDEADQECALYTYPLVPLEYRRAAKILVTNQGKEDRQTGEGERFALCPECGRHRPPQKEDETGGDAKWDERHRRLCSGTPVAVSLGYEFSTDILVIYAPADTLAFDASGGTDLTYLHTLAQALVLGAESVLEVEPQEIGAFIQTVAPDQGHAQIVLYETVPGGAGYLEEIAMKLSDVATAGYKRLFDHDCRKACYLCLKRYQNQRIHGLLDKTRVRDTLFQLMQEDAVEPKAGSAGSGLQALLNSLSERRAEAERMRREGATGAGPQSPIEAELLAAIRRIDGYVEPVAQHEVHHEDTGQLITVPDFAYPDIKIAVFCDGYQFHGDRETLELDARKRNYLQSKGWVVLVFWGRTINRDPDACARQVHDIYLQLRPAGQVEEAGVTIIDDLSRRYVDTLPLYSLKAAAGKFGEGQDIEEEGWVYVGKEMKPHEGMFVARVAGRSMEPTITDDSYCVFRKYEGGTRNGKIVLAQHRDIADPDTGGSYTVKRYRSTKVDDGTGSWTHSTIRLESDNSEYDSIEITEDRAGEFMVVAEYVKTI
jgi:ATP-dependent helicase YprA (DUF1998 family)/SOS-response transcriptional repressor LexA